MRKRSLVLIDRGALRSNLSLLKSKTKPGTMAYAVVKQDAYGHGAVETARILNGLAERFAVATVDEGIALRKAGITEPILVLEPVQEVIRPAYRNFDLTAVLSDIGQISLLEDGMRFQVEINTGMNRLGIAADQAAPLVSLLREQGRHPEAIFTHFASSMVNDPHLTREQYSRFRAVFHHFDDQVQKHAGNSEAVLQLPDAHFDAIRPGVALYGEGPGEGLKPAMSWLSYVAQSRLVSAEEGISYGWTWKAPSSTWVATVPVGYGEGYPRISSNKTLVCVDGKWFPQAGTVTMDYIMVDTGTLHAKPGTPVWLLTPVFTARHLAEVSGTISYELLCAIGNRNKRVYVDSFNDAYQLNIELIAGGETDPVLLGHH